MQSNVEGFYKKMGVSDRVYRFGEGVISSLAERFAAIDSNAEYNQMKVISAMQKNRVDAACFNESTGYGYGPGIGRDYDKLVLIISRASGAPLIANALSFADELVRGGVQKIAKAEFALADKAGLEELLRQKREASAPAAAKAEVKAPAKEPCTAGIPGIEVMDIEAAVQVLWAKDIYAESAMGCTGPLVLVSDANEERAKTLLREAGYIG